MISLVITSSTILADTELGHEFRPAIPATGPVHLSLTLHANMTRKRTSILRRLPSLFILRYLLSSARPFFKRSFRFGGYFIVDAKRNQSRYSMMCNEGHLRPCLWSQMILSDEEYRDFVFQSNGASVCTSSTFIFQVQFVSVKA